MKADAMELSSLKVHRDGHIVRVELARPNKGNAMNSAFWREYRAVFESLASDNDCRVIVVSAQGKHFSVGLDISGGMSVGGDDSDGVKRDPARKAMAMRRTVLQMQETFTAMERCPQPVIACVHGAAVGGAIDLLCAADIRVCSADAWFCIKEVDIGLAADVGTLQRLHHVMGNNSLARELCYTARRMPSAEALSAGFVSWVAKDAAEMNQRAAEMAAQIASKSPVAIAGTKVNLNFSRENKLQESLDFVATWNGAMLQTEDVPKAAVASMSKQDQPEFSKL